MTSRSMQKLTPYPWYDTEAKEVAALRKRFSVGGAALMGFGAWPFSEAYGWTTDRYGLS
jgi:predicted 3-demethylubiquinone-9 3-methyltransferase (glyoxalase superfamily)